MKRILVVLPALIMTAMVLWGFKSTSYTAQLTEISETESAPPEPTKETSEQKDFTIIPISEAKVLMAKADLASLICSNKKEKRTDIYNGFMGRDHYRIEFYISKVTPDANNPMQLNVEGKTRYKKNVTPFTGQISIENILKNKNTTNTVYQATGTFQFVEKESQKGAGQYKGKICFDFRNKIQNENYFLMTNDDDTRGGSLLLDGTFTSNKDGKTSNVIAAQYLFAFSNDILSDFYYGGRERTINPKYRALGWDDYWQHPEWWAEDNAPQKSSL